MPIRYARALLAALFTLAFLFVYGAAKAAPSGEPGDVLVDLPDVGLDGVNDESCESDAPPVVLVHGTFGTAAEHFNVLAPALQLEDHCVFALDYGFHATAPVAASAKELAAFVDDVLEATEAEQVDIVGYSQGGMMPRQYIRFEDGASEVNSLIGIAPSNHGTGRGILTGGLFGGGGGEPSATGTPVDADCLSCLDQLAGSGFLQDLNDGGDILTDEDGAHIHYTTIASRRDIVVIPYTSQALDGPPDRVTNLVLQDLCPDNRASHISIRNDPVTLQLVVNALENDGLADPDFQPKC